MGRRNIRSWCSLARCLACGTVTSLALGSSFVLAQLPVPAASPLEVVPSGEASPATLADPYIAASEAWSPPQRKMPVPPPIRAVAPSPTAMPAAMPPIEGEISGDDAPASYRLPNVSSFAPAPVAGAGVAQLPAISVPMPPWPNASATVDAPRTDAPPVAVADVRGGFTWPTPARPEAPPAATSPSTEVVLDPLFLPAPPLVAVPAMPSPPSAAHEFATVAPPAVEPPAPSVSVEELPPTPEIEPIAPPVLVVAPPLLPQLPASEPSPQPAVTPTLPMPEFALNDPVPCVPEAANRRPAPIATGGLTSGRAASPQTPGLTQQLLPAVQRGYALAQRGAMFAARTEFVQVLRRVAQAKDEAGNTDSFSRALANGLRAVDEAEDFVPYGAQLEAELEVATVASSHRTPLLADHAAEVSPQEAVAMYHRYAQEQLAACVGGEQAGSMALHGLGKVAATLAERTTGGEPALTRTANTMYVAAYAAHPGNHLAANELGVLLVRGGRANEAVWLFERAIDAAPTATAYHNLATAQQKLGLQSQAAANEQEAHRLAAWERSNGDVSRRAGVTWVSPDEMASVGQPGLSPGPGPIAQQPAPPKSAWQKTVDMAKSLPFVGGTKTR